MKNIFFFNSDRIPIMTWNNCSLETVNNVIQFNLKIEISIFTVSTIYELKYASLLELIKQLEIMYQKKIFHFSFEDNALKITMDRKIDGVILVKINLIEKTTENQIEVQYEFNQSFLPELIHELFYK